ncbi:IclR family transcriptional regulator [Pseudonocardia nematodicida]|uniref:IclR family transcriptional regulator n=1 Tax=Pseudonocardia nematodicida TaxID=1206997 RepID=A0ABV1KCW8_9PSEU
METSLTGVYHCMMKNRPAYGIESVDHALALATILKQEGPLRVTDAALRLGVAPSTAHRLLAMLVYRDFAERDDDRRYAAGPILRLPAAPEPVADLRRVAVPHLQDLVDRTDETANVLLVVDDQARFVVTVECGQALRIGDREGRVRPAHLTSAGRAVLATRSDAEVRALYAGRESEVGDVPALLRDLHRVRRLGFAVNDRQTEPGMTTVGCAVPGHPGVAVTLAMPTVRYRRERLQEWGGELATTADRIARGLSSVVVPGR